MTSQATVPIPNLFTPHPHLSEEVNRNIVQSDVSAGLRGSQFHRFEGIQVSSVLAPADT